MSLPNEITIIVVILCSSEKVVWTDEGQLHYLVIDVLGIYRPNVVLHSDGFIGLQQSSNSFLSAIVRLNWYC